MASGSHRSASSHGTTSWLVTLPEVNIPAAICSPSTLTPCGSMSVHFYQEQKEIGLLFVVFFSCHQRTSLLKMFFICLFCFCFCSSCIVNSQSGVTGTVRVALFRGQVRL